MSETLLPILVVIVIVIIAFKVVKKIASVILIIAVILIGWMLFQNMTDGKLSLETITSHFPPQVTQVQQQNQEEINKIVEKVKGMDTQQIEEYLKNAQSELEKHGLTIDAVKDALQKAKP
jgi:uncharacterized membrane protein YfhO